MSCVSYASREFDVCDEMVKYFTCNGQRFHMHQNLYLLDGYHPSQFSFNCMNR
jgi:hypothetical protein